MEQQTLKIIDFIVGEWTVLLTVLVIFMGLDIVTGVMKAKKNKCFASAISSEGLLKKVGIFIGIIVANLLDVASNHSLGLRTICISVFLGSEGLSVAENLKILEVPLPEQVDKYICNLKNNKDIDHKTERKLKR